MSNKFMRGASLLLGNNTIPGVKMPDSLRALVPVIFDACDEFGLDYFKTAIEFLTYDQISEIAAYGGFPVRYPHWKWGMEYEELQRGYQYGMHRIYEMVINTNPCYIYCLDSNTLVDNVTVIAHALGHNDFFKNNIFFEDTHAHSYDGTSYNMLNTLANHGTRIRRYMARWGDEKVMEFIDWVQRVETLIDPAHAWMQQREKPTMDTRKYYQPNRLVLRDHHDYMEPHLNPSGWRDEQNEKIVKKEAAESIGIFKKPTRDILGFIRDNAPLKPWQQDIVAMLHKEAMYFAPQRITKMINEGWASFVDSNIMARTGLAGLGQESEDCGIVEYAMHKAGVLGGKYSQNPYKLGYTFFCDIEERWNKGRFGNEYEECKNAKQKENWNTETNLGKEKVFEVRKYYDDILMLAEFFTEEFCHKYEFYEWKYWPKEGEYRIENREFKPIKAKLMQRYLNGGLPEIQLVDPNHKGKGGLLLDHVFEGRELYEGYLPGVMAALNGLWGNTISLATRDSNGEEKVFVCTGTDEENVKTFTREEYDAL